MEIQFLHNSCAEKDPKLLMDHIRRMGPREAPFFSKMLGLVYGRLIEKAFPRPVPSGSGLGKSIEVQAIGDHAPSLKTSTSVSGVPPAPTRTWGTIFSDPSPEKSVGVRLDRAQGAHLEESVGVQLDWPQIGHQKESAGVQLDWTRIARSSNVPPTPTRTRGTQPSGSSPEKSVGVRLDQAQVVHPKESVGVQLDQAQIGHRNESAGDQLNWALVFHPPKKSVEAELDWSTSHRRKASTSTSRAPPAPTWTGGILPSGPLPPTPSPTSPSVSSDPPPRWVSLVCNQCGKSRMVGDLHGGTRCPECPSRGGKRGRPYMRCELCNTARVTPRITCAKILCGASFI